MSKQPNNRDTTDHDSMIPPAVNRGADPLPWLVHNLRERLADRSNSGSVSQAAERGKESD